MLLCINNFFVASQAVRRRQSLSEDCLQASTYSTALSKLNCVNDYINTGIQSQYRIRCFICHLFNTGISKLPRKTFIKK